MVLSFLLLTIPPLRVHLAFEAAGLGNLTMWFVVFSAIQGVKMAPGMIQEKQDEVKRLQSEDSE